MDDNPGRNPPGAFPARAQQPRTLGGQASSRFLGGAASRFGSRRQTGGFGRTGGGGGGMYRNSTLLHKGQPSRLSAFTQTFATAVAHTATRSGFYDLLAVLAPDNRTSSPLRDDDSPRCRSKPTIRKPIPVADAAFSTHTSPLMVQPQSQPHSAARIDFGGPKKLRRITKDMISSPFNLVHVLHASDVDLAKEYLISCSVEGVGKIPGASPMTCPGSS